MPLKLSLKPSEAVIVNGAVMRNGDRRGVMVLENQARVMREKDVVFPEQVRGAAEFAYFAVMQLYLTGDTDGVRFDEAMDGLSALARETRDDLVRQRAVDVALALSEADTYTALSKCRKLLKATGGVNA